MTMDSRLQLPTDVARCDNYVIFAMTFVKTKARHQLSSTNGMSRRHLFGAPQLLIILLYLCIPLTPVCGRSVSNHANQYPRPNCVIEQTEPVGTVNLSHCFSLSHADALCHCHWKVTVSMATDVAILVSDSNFFSFSGGRFPGEEPNTRQIDVIHTGIPVMKQENGDGSVVFHLKTNSFIVKLKQIRHTSGNQHEIASVVLSYVATSVNLPRQLCPENFFQEIPNGHVIITNRTIGSRARVRCEVGFRPSQADSDPVCGVANNALAWDSWLGNCLPECPERKPALHGTVQIKQYPGFRKHSSLHSRMEGISTKNTKNSNILSIAEHSCEKPYQLRGHKWSLCLLDDHGRPFWARPLPQCAIPSCTLPTRLTGESGTIVHPSFPNPMAAVREIKCQWIIIPKRVSVIDFTIQFMNLPDCSKSFLEFRSIKHFPSASPVVFANSSRAISSFSVRTTGLVITYHQHPACPLTEPHGFSIRYEILPYHRTRRDVTSADKDQNTSEGTLPNPPNAMHGLSDTGATTQKSTNPEADSASDNTWKIAVGVIVPILVFAVLFFIGYKIYRRKFPVRMILGREFSKFRNPNYTRPGTRMTLVREDADDVFSRIQASSEHNPDFALSDFNVAYDNKAFEGDDGIDSEERQDQEYRLKKSWLFRKDDVTDGVSSEGKQGKEENSQNDIDENKEYSDDSDIESILQGQKTTPGFQRKRISVSGLSTSTLSSDHDDASTKEFDLPGSCEDELNESRDNDEVDSVKDGAKVIETVLYQQPTVDEVRALMKARARSMSIEKPKEMPRQRSQSIQIDPSKSARRMSSINFLEERRNSMDDSLDAGRSNPSLAERDLVKFLHKQKITASIVEIQYLSKEDHDLCCSLSSISSNPHLVTDLDDSDKNEDEITTENVDGNNMVEETNSKEERSKSDSYLKGEHADIDGLNCTVKDTELTTQNALGEARVSVPLDPPEREGDLDETSNKVALARKGYEHKKSIDESHDADNQTDKNNNADDAVRGGSLSSSSSASNKSHLEELNLENSPSEGPQHLPVIPTTEDFEPEHVIQTVENSSQHSNSTSGSLPEHGAMPDNSSVEHFECDEKLKSDSKEGGKLFSTRESGSGDSGHEETKDMLCDSGITEPGVESNCGVQPMNVSVDGRVENCQIENKPNAYSIIEGNQTPQLISETHTLYEVERESGKTGVSGHEEENKALRKIDYVPSIEDDEAVQLGDSPDGMSRDDHVRMEVICPYAGGQDESKVGFDIHEGRRPADDSHPSESPHGGGSDGRLRIISGIRLSDSSSNSSDMLDDHSFQSPTHSDKPAGSAAQPQQRIAFNANDISLDDDQETTSAMNESSFDISTVTETDGEEEDEEEEGGGADREYDVFKREHGEEKEDRQRQAPSSTDPSPGRGRYRSESNESSSQRDRSSTGCSNGVDIYGEFSDEAIDAVFSKSSVDLRGAEADGSGSNSPVAEKRTIRVDSKVMFEFQNSPKVRVRDDSDDKDVDV